MAEPAWYSQLAQDPALIPLAVTGDGKAGEPPDDFPDDGGKWVVIAPPEVRLHPSLATIVAEAAALRRDVDLFYGDEAVSGSNRLLVKPDFDLTLLMADDAVGWPLLVRSSAMRRLGGLRPEAATAAGYDLVLRLLAGGGKVCRITEVLAVHAGEAPRAATADRRKALLDWMGDAAEVFELLPGLAPGTLRRQRRFVDYPDVTVVIPTRQSGKDNRPDGRAHIVTLLEGIAASDWPAERLTVLVGDDCPDGAIYDGRHWPFRFRRLVTARDPGQTFNYAAKMNYLWRQADTEQLVLLNDDIEIGRKDWLQALLSFSMERDVGGVGGRLLYPDGTIQHAGIAGGLFGFLAHAWLGQPADLPSYGNWASVHRQWSMVTGAVFATRKSLLELFNGFDEAFSLEFNDVDLCLRLVMFGYRIVCTPFAEFVHWEKASRGQVLPPAADQALFLQRWSRFLDQDPAFHPRLARGDFRLSPVEPVGEWWQSTVVA